MKKLLLLPPIALIALGMSLQTARAQDAPTPDIILTLDGSQSEGFAISGTTAYNSSPDGSIYKMDLETGMGEVLVPVVDPQDCTKLGMRVDSRTNYLFVAGCVSGTAMVFDAEDGTLLMEYQLGPGQGQSIINDLAITEDAVYFTNARRPVIHRLPLGTDGEIPANADGVEDIPLPSEFEIDDETFCCGGNGIVAMDDGQSLIVGHSNLGRIYHVDLLSGAVVPIPVQPALSGFLDGIAATGQTLYILTPNQTGGPYTTDTIQVVRLADDLASGERERVITNSELQGIASGAILGTSLYVNNARYEIFPPETDTRYWITKLENAVDGPELINDDLSGLWRNPEATGQGFFLDVSPKINLFFGGFLTWTSMPGEKQWFTLQGGYSGNTASLTIYQTTGGAFNEALATQTEAIGMAEFVFTSRTKAQVTLQFDDSESSIVIPLERLTPTPPNG